MKQLSEWEAKGLLAKSGIRVTNGAIAKNSDDARTIAMCFDKVAMKISSPDIVHKSDAGGVILNKQYYDVEKEYSRMISRIKDNFPDARIDGILVEEMAPSGYELIIGLKQDPQFGQIIMVGMGGIYAEVYKDVSFRVTPVTVLEAYKMLEELKGYKILTGIRGREAANLYNIAEIVKKVSQLKNIVELDINPLIVNSETAIAADARATIE